MLLAPGSSTRVSRPLTSVVNHTLWLEVEEGRENRVRTHTAQAPALAGALQRRWQTELALFLLSCSGKLYIQLYPSSPSTSVMLLQ